MSYAVGCVPYLNAKPMVWPFRADDSPVQVRFDVPSRLPAMLDAGEVQAILVSSIESLRRPRAADGVSISSRGPVASVRMFSRVPFGQIERLALDQSSMTSNALGQILLAELHGVRPQTRTLPNDLEIMLSQADAGILIGDAGMRTEGEGLHIMDLGEAWTILTGLPFVWALWVGGSELDAKLAVHLATAPPTTLGVLESVLPQFATESGFDIATARHYFTEIMDYGFGDEHRRGLAAFADRITHHGLAQDLRMPEFVGFNATAAPGSGFHRGR